AAGNDPGCRASASLHPPLGDLAIEHLDLRLDRRARQAVGAARAQVGDESAALGEEVGERVHHTHSLIGFLKNSKSSGVYSTPATGSQSQRLTTRTVPAASTVTSSRVWHITRARLPSARVTAWCGRNDR